MLIRRVAAVAFVCALAVPGYYVVAQDHGSSSPGGNQASEQELVKLTQDFAAAERKSDTTALDRLTSDDFTFTHSSGNVQDRASYLESLQKGTRRYEHFDLENVTARVYGSAAITSAHVHVEVGGSARSTHDFRAQVSFTWIRQAQGWRMVALQLTEIPERAPGPRRTTPQ